MNFASALAIHDIIQRLPHKKESMRAQFWYQFTGNLQLAHCNQILQQQWRAENSIPVRQIATDIKWILTISKQEGSC